MLEPTNLDELSNCIPPTSHFRMAGFLGDRGRSRWQKKLCSLLCHHSDCCAPGVKIKRHIVNITWREYVDILEGAVKGVQEILLLEVNGTKLINNYLIRLLYPHFTSPHIDALNISLSLSLSIYIYINICLHMFTIRVSVSVNIIIIIIIIITTIISIYAL